MIGPRAYVVAFRGVCSRSVPAFWLPKLVRPRGRPHRRRAGNYRLEVRLKTHDTSGVRFAFVFTIVAIAILPACQSGSDEVRAAVTPPARPDLVFTRWVSQPWIYVTSSVDPAAERRIARGRSARWSPDGNSIAYSDREVDSRIVVLNMRTGKRRLFGAGSTADWSPDGRHIAFVADAPDIVVAMVSTGVRRRIRLDEVDRERFEIVDEDIAWSPDGRWIAFVMSASHGSSDTGGFNDLFVVRPDGSGLRNVTRGRVSDSACPSWSPDSRRIAFAGVDWRMRRGHLQLRKLVYVIARDGQRLELLGNGFQPDWSPDGKTIAIANGSGSQCAPHYDARPSIYVMEPNGRSLRRLRAGSGPRWSRDSRKLVVETRGGLYVVTRDSKSARRVTTNAADGDADWR